MDTEHLSLLLRLWILLHNADVQYALITEASIHLKTLEELEAEVEAYFAEHGWKIDHSDLAGWGLFPVSNRRT
jgi:hypothetical protein